MYDGVFRDVGCSTFFSGIPTAWAIDCLDKSVAMAFDSMRPLNGLEVDLTVAVAIVAGMVLDWPKPERAIDLAIRRPCLDWYSWCLVWPLLVAYLSLPIHSSAHSFANFVGHFEFRLCHIDLSNRWINSTIQRLKGVVLYAAVLVVHRRLVLLASYMDRWTSHHHHRCLDSTLVSWERVAPAMKISCIYVRIKRYFFIY